MREAAPASESDAKVLTICRMSNQLAEAETEIYALEGAIEETVKTLKEQQNKLKALFTAKRRLTCNGTTRSSLHSLSREVLNEIFVAALRVKDFDHRTQITRTTLRLVSREWNDVILSDPRLWTDIFISLALKEIGGQRNLDPYGFPWHAFLPTTIENAFDCIRQRMERSASLPRHLRLQSPCLYIPWFEEKPDVNPALVPFIHKITNWQSMDLALDSEFGLVFEIFKPTTKNLPTGIWNSLRSLKVKTTQTAVESMDRADEEFNQHLVDEEEQQELLAVDPPVVFPGSAFPSLRSVTLHLPGRNLLQWSLPWERLTSLELAGLCSPFCHVLPVVGKCQALESLSIWIDLANRSSRFPSTLRLGEGRNLSGVTLPHLHTLVLRSEVECDMLPWFVRLLTLPRLASLTYDNTYNMDEEGVSYSEQVLAVFSGLIRRSGCIIDSLVLRLFEATLDDTLFLQFLELTPSLRKLTLGAQRLTCCFLNSGEIPETLTKIKLIKYAHSKWDPEPKFVDFARRWCGMGGGDGSRGRRRSGVELTLATVIHGWHKRDATGVEFIDRLDYEEKVEKLQEEGYWVSVGEAVEDHPFDRNDFLFDG